MKQTRANKSRIRQLENSRLLHDPELSNLPEEDVKILREGKHENKELQRKFNTAAGLLLELMRLKGTLVKRPNQTT